MLNTNLQFNPANIDDECAALYQVAIERIDSRMVAAHMFSDYINQLPAIASGTYMLAKKVRYGKKQVNESKEQNWNDALWLIGLSLLAEFKALNSYNVAGALLKWSVDAENSLYQLTDADAQSMGEWVIIGMQNYGWLSQVPTEMVDLVEGEYRKVRKFKCTPTFDQSYELAKEELVERSHMACEPLRNKPLPWTDNFTGVSAYAKLRLVKGRKSKYVAKKAIDAANRAQSVAYEVHEDMSKLASLVVDNENDFRTALGYADGAKKDKWKGVFEQWKKIAGLPTDTALYFPVTYDFRGRMYYRGGVVSPQGSDCCKAAFTFRTGYPLGKSGFTALCVGLATALGSKESIETKVRQVQQGANEIFSYVERVEDFRLFCQRYTKADYCQAWLLARELKRVYDWVNEGREAKDFISNVPVHQDGTCSGLQHIAVITRDLATAAAVNMTPATRADKPADVYNDVVVEANKGLNFELTRKQGKPCVMLGGYGASEDTIKHDVALEMKENGHLIDQAWPELERAMNVVAPALGKFTQAVKSRADQALAKGTVELVWKTADGFEVVQQYVDNSANVFHGKLYSGHINRFDVTLDTLKMITATSPNLIHSNDSCHLRLAILTSRMDVALVHDSYGTHACNYFAFNKVLRNCFYDMYAEHDVMSEFSERNGVRAFSFLDNGYKLEMAKEAINCFG